MSHLFKVVHLADVSISGQADNDILISSSGKWVNTSKTNFFNNYLLANQANGFLQLNSQTKIDADYLPTSAMEYKGTWDPGTGSYPTNPDTGDFYICSGSGTVSSVTYAEGDQIIYNGTSWDKIDNTDETLTDTYIRSLFSAEAGSNITYNNSTGEIGHANHIVSVPSLSGGAVYDSLVVDGEGHVTSVGTRTITASDVGAASLAFKQFKINVTDSGFTWLGTTATVVATATDDEMKFVAGDGIQFKHDVSNKAIKIIGSSGYIHPTPGAQTVSLTTTHTGGVNPSLDTVNSLTITSNNEGHVTAASGSTTSITAVVKDIAGYILHNATKTNITMSYNSTTHTLAIEATHPDIIISGSNVALNGSGGTVVQSLTITRDSDGHVTNLNASPVDLDSRYMTNANQTYVVATAASYSVSTSYSIHILAGSVSGASLPSPSSGYWFTLKNARTSNITVTVDGGANIYGGQSPSTSYVLQPQTAITVICDGTDYYVL